MASVNKVIIVGYLGRDPEIRYSSDNSLQICTLTVATSRSVRNAQGERNEETEWHRVVVFGKSAEFAQRFLRKGSLTYVEGRLRTRRWERDGQPQYTTEIIADNIQSLERRQEGQMGAADSDFESSGRQPRAYSQPQGQNYQQTQSFESRPQSRPAPSQAAPQSAAPAPSPMTDDSFSDDDIPF